MFLNFFIYKKKKRERKYKKKFNIEKKVYLLEKK